MESDKIEKFDPLDTTNIGQRWKRWLSMFEIFADSKGLIISAEPERNANKQRRRALLLHSAGPDVQDIFQTLPDTARL